MKPILYLFLLSSLFLLSHQIYSALTFDRLLSQVRGLPMKTIAVSGCAGDEVLKSVRAAKDRGIADSVLFGDEDKIKNVHDGHAQMYMKGTINTKDFLKAILDKKIGLRTGRPLSTVAVFEVEGLHKMLFLTDPAVMPYPTLEEKVHIIYNTIDICNACGIKLPKVAPLATVEVVNPKMPETVEGAKLKEMNERGEITGCVIDGPLSMDLAIDPIAAVEKRATNRKIVGDADVLLFPNIHGANFAYKILTHVAKSKSAIILTGTSMPVVLTSRSDSFESKLNSIILAVVYAEHIKNKVTKN